MASNNSDSETAVILLAHGSKDETWRAWFAGLSDSLAQSLGPGRVRHAYLQFAPPTLMDAVGAAIDEGFGKIAILPVFISAGGHVMKDVPQQVASVQEQTSGVEISILPHIGQAPEFEALIRSLTLKASDG